jgi:hypothetical protein
MFICSDELLWPGEQSAPWGQLSDINKDYQSQPFVVLRRATQEEYEDYCRREWSFFGPWEPRTYYYLIATD